MNKVVTLFSLFILVLTASAYAQEYEKGLAAADRGDFAAAIREWRPLAEQGHVGAQFNLGVMYEKHGGDGASPNRAEALKWYRRAAGQGDVRAQYELGSMYWSTPTVRGVGFDYAEAAKWYRKAAEQGHAAAQYYLAVLYGSGAGKRGLDRRVPQDNAEAIKWLRKAAVQGFLEAQSLLGLLYDRGEGVQQDFEEAARWYRKAAEQGVGEAQFGLGMMYQEGRGVPKDNVKALMWLNLATDDREVDGAVEKQQMVSKMMTAEQIAEAQRMIRARKEELAEREEELAKRGEELVIQGFRSEFGDAERTHLSAEAGGDRAQYKLGFLYEEGRGVKQDLVQAHAWYDIAALRGKKTAAVSRDRIARKMTPAQIAEAKRLVRKIGNKVGVPQAITKHDVEPGASDARVCAMSTGYGDWASSKLFQDWVEEAHKRNLSLDECEALLKAN